MEEKILLLLGELNTLIASKDFQKEHKLKEHFFTRNRKLCFDDIILFILRLPQKTLSTEMSDYVSDIISKKGIQSISKQAFSVARQKISAFAFEEILNFTYRFLTEVASPASCWHGYNVKAIDGTTFCVPNTTENKNYFQTQKNQHTEVALIKASALYNVSNDLFEKVVIGKCRDSEKAQALELLSYDVFHNQSNSPSIVTFDRGYPSGELINHIIENEGLFLMRCSSATFKKVLACPEGDTVTHITYNKKQIKLRVIRFFLDSGAEEILITNLFDDSLTVDDFKELYFLRWSVEVKYKEIKQQLKIENFSGSKPIAVLQDIYATLAFANIASALKVIVDKKIKVDTKEKGNKLQYQTNRNFLLGELKKKLHLLLGNIQSKCKSTLQELLFLAQKIRSPIRLGRKNNRICGNYKNASNYRMNQRTSM